MLAAFIKINSGIEERHHGPSDALHNPSHPFKEWISHKKTKNQAKSDKTGHGMEKWADYANLGNFIYKRKKGEKENEKKKDVEGLFFNLEVGCNGKPKGPSYPSLLISWELIACPLGFLLFKLRFMSLVSAGRVAVSAGSAPFLLVGLDFLPWSRVKSLDLPSILYILYCENQPSILQLEYAPTTYQQQQPEFSQPDT
ncbi:hypothetical protein Tco_0642630, partial [Tanacetum coccineum]